MSDRRDIEYLTAKSIHYFQPTCLDIMIFSARYLNNKWSSAVPFTRVNVIVRIWVCIQTLKAVITNDIWIRWLKLVGVLYNLIRYNRFWSESDLIAKVSNFKAERLRFKSHQKQIHALTSLLDHIQWNLNNLSSIIKTSRLFKVILKTQSHKMYTLALFMY